jgi:hypothetical protein
MRAQVATLLKDPAAICPPLALWGLMSPWILGYGETSAIEFHLPWAIAFLPLSVLCLGLRQALWLMAAGGVLMAIAPMAFGFADLGAAAVVNDAATGLLLAAASLASLRRAGPS